MVAETIVTGIHNKVGRTGVITPVAILQPVECGGVKVSKASLMNWDEIARLGGGIGNGSRVSIERSGEVIPRIVAILSKSSQPFERPEDCPSCGAETFIDGPRQVCRNPECTAQTFRNVLHWTKTRDIKHLGEETLDRLMSLDGPVATIADLYTLTHEQLKQAAGGDTMAEKIAKELEKSRDCTTAQLLGCVGIKGIGVVEATKVCVAFYVERYSDVKLIRMTEAAKLAAVLGPIKSQKFIDGANKDRVNISRLWKLLRVTPVKAREAVDGSEWSGKKFAITGTTEMVRSALAKRIEDAGGIYKSSVVKGLDFLLTNNTD